MRDPVGLINAATLRAGAAGIPGVNEGHRDPLQPGLIFDEQPELVKSPRVVLPSLGPSDNGSLPDALEVFQGDAQGVPGSLFDNTLADDMVHITGETALLPSALQEQPLSRAGSPGLKPGPEFGMTLSEPVEVAPGVAFPLGVGEDVDDAQVAAQEACGLIGSRLGNLDYLVDEEPLVPIGEGGLAGLLAQGNTGGEGIEPAIDADSPVMAIGVLEKRDGAQGSEGGQGIPMGLVLVSGGHLANSYQGGRRGEAESLPCLVVGPSLEGEPVKELLSKSDSREPVAGGVEAGYDVEEGLGLLWPNLHLGYELHALIVAIGGLPVKFLVLKG